MILDKAVVPLKMFDLNYFIYLLASLVVTVAVYFILKNKSNNTKKWTLFAISLSGFIIHFLKIFIYPYTTIEGISLIRKVSFENISATHTMLFPWIFLSDNKKLKDYMVMAGITAGLIPLLLPLDAVSPNFDGNLNFGYKDVYSIEVIRFYYAHLVMMLVPLMMVIFDLHKVEYKRAYNSIFVFLGVLTILFINELFLVSIKAVDKSSLFNRNDRNPSFIFGVRDDVAKFAGFVLIFVPRFMRYWPILYLIGPILVYGGLFITVLNLLFDRKNMIEGIKNVFNKKEVVNKSE